MQERNYIPIKLFNFFLWITWHISQPVAMLNQGRFFLGIRVFCHCFRYRRIESKLNEILPGGTQCHWMPLTPIYLHLCFQFQTGVCWSLLPKPFWGKQLIEALIRVTNVCSSEAAEPGLHQSLGEGCHLLWKPGFPFTFVTVPAPQLESEFQSTILNPRKFLILRE